MKVDIDCIKHLKRELKEINDVDLSEIEFYENGVKLTISDTSTTEWKFTGLNNTDFIMTEAYLD